MLITHISSKGEKFCREKIKACGVGSAGEMGTLGRGGFCKSPERRSIRVQERRGDLRVLGFLLAETQKEKPHLEIHPEALKPEWGHPANGALKAHRFLSLIHI